MYVRKVKKGGKTYLYYYKSQRIGNKVKSIYVGKALERPANVSTKISIKTYKNKTGKLKLKPPLKPIKNTELINKLLEFDNLIFEVNRLIVNKDLKNSINIYNKMLEIYSTIDLHVEDKQKIFNKLSSIYDELVNLSKEHNLE